MRTVLAAAIAFLCLTLPALGDQTVVGTGTPAMDVANVQKAVDAGGIIVLRGNFDFGPDGRVKITKSTRIRGEKDESGEPRTTITGGFWTFYSPLPVPGATPSGTGPIVAVHSIHFHHAKGTPLHFPYTGGVDVRGCTVTGTKPQNTPIKWSGGDSLSFLAGVVVGNRIDHPAKRIKRAATGVIRIENNRFEMETDKPGNTAGYGVMVDWTSGADIAVKDNVIRRASRNGIEVLDNTLGPKLEGTIRIENNRIVTEDEGIEYPHKYGPNGIVTGWYFDTRGGVDITRNSLTTLMGNRVEARGDLSTGLLLYADDIVATCNDVIMAGGEEARGIVQTGSRGFFSNNRVRGEARDAIYCYPFEALRASSNTFAWTELNDFTGFRSQVLLGGNVNIIIGTPPALSDKGKGNRVVETAPCSLPEASPEGEEWKPVTRD